MESTYKDKILKTFEKIISIPKKKSDNFGRISRIKKFSNKFICSMFGLILQTGSLSIVDI